MNIPYVFKKCTKCGEWLVANNINFYKQKKGKYGFSSKCKKCESKIKKDKRSNDKEYRDKQNKKEREEMRKKRKDDNFRKIENEKQKIRKKERYNNDEEYRKSFLKKQNEWKVNNPEKVKASYDKKCIKEKERYNNDEEYRKSRLKKCKEWRKDNPEKIFNQNIERRSKLENQGRGIDKEQYKECNKWFDWKCAYSGEKLQNNKTTNGRTLDHIVAIENGGLNEPWNVVPMKKGYNCSKKHRYDALNWYMEQEYFNEEQLQRIVEWQIYAYEKWGGEEFGELILITDLFEEEE